MNTRLLKSLLRAACVLSPLAMPFAAPVTAQSVVRPAQDISLAIGNGQLVNVPGAMTDVFVANDAVADVQVKSRNQFYLFGKAGGTTTVYASNAAGAVVWSATIRVGSNIDSVDSMLHLAMPEARIGVSTVGTGTFLLTGTVKSPEDAAEAERLVQAYVGKEANVISRLRLATPVQVNLQVRIAEVSRTLVKQLQTNITTIDGTGGFQFGLGQGRSGWYDKFNTGGPLGMGNTIVRTNPDGTTTPGTGVNPITTGSTLAGMGKLFGMNILGALDAGETVGLSTTLAQPNLTTLSGETANFLAGGEYPIPVAQGGTSNTISVEYKNYGVSLSYTPTVLSNGRISMRVRPEVSELTADGAVSLNGYSVPALNVRRAETTVELGSGQSFMIAGLLSNNSQNTIQKLPGAGDIPILGSLFRSTNYKRGETELVIVVTPYLVNPVDANDIKLPTDGFNAPNDLQRLLGNMASDGAGNATPAPAANGNSAPAGPSVGGEARASDGKGSKGASASGARPGFSMK
ncbi:type II and III secretion system protein family protein [Novosphingobium sp. BL-8H]|uniref:type II and III secretion system protein family protein n=1 Tax=Novosphingobium sp. BL-8H TaxID=3127640 RepID=UPI0037580346